MPCNCDHMEPSKWEKESKKVAKLIVWSYNQLDEVCPTWIQYVANNTHGDIDKVHDLTAILCKCCKTLSEDVIYDGRNKTARRLADWWDNHQEADRIKEEAEIELNKNIELASRGLAKLTPEEREALGL